VFSIRKLGDRPEPRGFCDHRACTNQLGGLEFSWTRTVEDPALSSRANVSSNRLARPVVDDEKSDHQQAQDHTQMEI